LRRGRRVFQPDYPTNGHSEFFAGADLPRVRGLRADTPLLSTRPDVDPGGPVKIRLLCACAAISSVANGAHAEPPSPSILEFAEVAARLDDLCPSRRAVGLDAAADALNAAPQRGGLAPLIYAGDDYAFLSAVAAAASALNDSTRPGFLRAGIDAMIRAVDPHGGYIGPSDRSTASQAPAERRVTGRIEDDIGVIVIPNFNEGTAEFIQETAERIGAARGQGLVIDLRGNPGGLVDEVVASADLFLEAGTVMLSEPTAYCLNDEARTFSSRAGDIAHGLPIIVIIDGETASGAESFALALMQRGRARTLGARSQGAGLQQTLTPVRLDNGTVGALRLTSGELLGPTGSRINGIGVQPDVLVDAVEGRDAPMERAINILREASR